VRRATGRHQTLDGGATNVSVAGGATGRPDGSGRPALAEIGWNEGDEEWERSLNQRSASGVRRENSAIWSGGLRSTTGQVSDDFADALIIEDRQNAARPTLPPPRLAPPTLGEIDLMRLPLTVTTAKGLNGARCLNARSSR